MQIKMERPRAKHTSVHVYMCAVDSATINISTKISRGREEERAKDSSPSCQQRFIILYIPSAHAKSRAVQRRLTLCMEASAL